MDRIAKHQVPADDIVIRLNALLGVEFGCRRNWININEIAECHTLQTFSIFPDISRFAKLHFRYTYMYIIYIYDIHI